MCRHALPEGRCRQRQILAGRISRSPDCAAGRPQCVQQRKRHRACASAVQEAEEESTQQSELDEDGSLGLILSPSEPLAVIVGGGTCGALLVGGPHPLAPSFLTCLTQIIKKPCRPFKPIWHSSCCMWQALLLCEQGWLVNVYEKRPR